MADDTELLMKGGRRAYQEFVASKIAIKTAARMAELELDFLEIDIREKMRQGRKALKSRQKESK